MYIIGDADKKLCQTWSSNLQQAQQARISFERQWHQNMSFYFDRQWIVIERAANGSGFTLSEAPQSDRFRTRHTANRIKRIVRNELAQLCKEEPQFYTEPDSTEEEDRAAASAADAIAEYLIYSKYFNKRRRSATFWALMCGTSFLKNWYDPDAIELDGQPGKIDFEAVTAFHGFVPYLQEEDLQKQPWFIHARALSPEYVWNCWKVEVEPDTDVAQTLMDSRFLTSMGIQQTRNKASKMCYIKEVYVKPCKEFPNGAAFVVSDDKVIYVYENESQDQMLSAQPGVNGDSLQMELFQSESTPVGNENAPEKVDVTGITGERNYEFPYTHGNFPFAKIDHVTTGMFYGESIIKPLIPLQKEYNRTRSIMLDTRNLAGKPQWAYQKGAIDPKHFNSKPGLLLAYNMGFEPPKPLDQPELPASVAQDLGVTIQDMDDVSSQFEVSKGRTPPGVEAASAIAYLQEENNTILFPTIASLEEAVQETGIQVLTLVHDYWDPLRIISMTSKNNAYEVRKFSASKLKQRSDFRVIPQSMAPRSSAARQAQIIEYMKMGIAPPEKLLGLIPMNETRTMFQMLTLDERHAQRENMKMAEGEPINVRMDGPPTVGMMGAEVPTPRTNTRIDPMTGQPELDEATQQPVTYIVTVNSWDNHQKHVEVHSNYMKTQEFELLPEKVRQVFEDHLEEHKLELAKEVMYSNQMGASQQGSAPPPGGQQEQPIQEGEVVA